MDAFVIGLLGGVVPAVVMLLVYFVSFAGRIVRMENDIAWLKREFFKCQPPSKDHLA